MSNIIPFQFDALSVRVITDEHGAPWFNANDVCNALKFGNPFQAIKSHVEEDDLQKLEVIDNLGRTQLANHVNESGLYALIFGSTKETAKRFKKWVTSEVLPSIRKTGSYSAVKQKDTIDAIMLLGDFVAKVPGVKPGIAAAATMACVQRNTGLSTEDLRLALPAADEPLCTLNATQLGKLLNRSAKAMNVRLASCGLQRRNARDEWELTEAGRKWAEALPFSRNGHSSYQILWNPAVADIVQSNEV